MEVLEWLRDCCMGLGRMPERQTLFSRVQWLPLAMTAIGFVTHVWLPSF